MSSSSRASGNRLWTRRRAALDSRRKASSRGSSQLRDRWSSAVWSACSACRKSERTREVLARWVQAFALAASAGGSAVARGVQLLGRVEGQAGDSLRLPGVLGKDLVRALGQQLEQAPGLIAGIVPDQAPALFGSAGEKILEEPGSFLPFRGQGGPAFRGSWFRVFDHLPDDLPVPGCSLSAPFSRGLGRSPISSSSHSGQVNTWRCRARLSSSASSSARNLKRALRSTCRLSIDSSKGPTGMSPAEPRLVLSDKARPQSGSTQPKRADRRTLKQGRIILLRAPGPGLVI